MSEHSRRSREQEQIYLNDLTAFVEKSRILQKWEPRTYLDKGTFSRIFRVVNRETGEDAVLKFVPNPPDLRDCQPKGTPEGEYHLTRFEASKAEAEIMRRFRGEDGVVQYLEEPEYLEYTFINDMGDQVTQYAVLICMPLYINSKMWIPAVVGNRRKSLQLGIEIAKALVSFEEKGVFHRDIKPGNILMDRYGHFYLSDVGEAKQEGTETTFGFHGTPLYMAPEVYQLRDQMRRMRSDHRSDLYSLGIILYRLFNQQQFPFLDDDGSLTEDAKISFKTYVDRMRSEDGEDLSTAFTRDSERARVLRYEGVSLPPPSDADPVLAQVILRASAYGMEERYQSARDLQHALRCCAEGSPLPVELGWPPTAARVQQAQAELTQEIRIQEAQAQEQGELQKGHSERTSGRQKGENRADARAYIAALMLIICVLTVLLLGSRKSEEPDVTPTAVPTATSTATQTVAPTAMSTATSTMVPTVTPTGHDTPEPIDSRPASAYARLTKDAVNLHRTPSASGTSLGRIPMNTVLRVLSERYDGTYTWYRVNYDGKDGYVRSDMAQMLSSAELREYQAEQAQNSAQPSANATQIAMSTATSTMVPTVTPTGHDTPELVDSRPAGAYAKLTKDAVNLHRTPSTSGTSLGRIPMNTVLRVLSERYDGTYTWYRVNYDGKDGYVRSDMAQMLSSAELREYQAEQAQNSAQPSANATPTTVPTAELAAVFASAADFETTNLGNGTCEITKYSGTAVELMIPSVIGGERVVSIGESAFESCDTLMNVTIPESVTSIGHFAFRYCNSLADVTIPVGVTSIGEYAFKNCSSLTNITIPDGVTSIGYCTFDGCSSLTNVTIPVGVTSIGVNAFYGCSSLTNVTIPVGVTSIGVNAFYGCRSLANVTIPDSVTSIGYGAFGNCRSLTDIAIPNGVTSIGDRAFEECSSLRAIHGKPGSKAEKLAAELGVEFISTGDAEVEPTATSTSGTTPEADPSVWLYTSKELADGTLTITGYYGDSSRIVIPAEIDGKRVTAIADNAFYGIDTLVEVTVPEGVAQIGNQAFSLCINLELIRIPNTVTELKNNPFVGCEKLTQVLVDERNPSIAVKEGMLIADDVLVAGINQKGIVRIPEGIKRIGVSAFKDNNKISYVYIPEGVEEIMEYAFLNCNGIERVEIPDSLLRFGNMAFGGDRTPYVTPPILMISGNVEVQTILIPGMGWPYEIKDAQ